MPRLTSRLKNLLFTTTTSTLLLASTNVKAVDIGVRINMQENMQERRDALQAAIDQQGVVPENHSGYQPRPRRPLDMSRFAHINPLAMGGGAQTERGIESNNIADVGQVNLGGFANIAALFGGGGPQVNRNHIAPSSTSRENIQSLRTRQVALRSDLNRKEERLRNLTTNAGIIIVGNGQDLRIEVAPEIPVAPIAPPAPVLAAHADVRQNMDTPNRGSMMAAIFEQIRNNGQDAQRDIVDPLESRRSAENTDQPHPGSNYQRRMKSWLEEAPGRTVEDWMAFRRAEQTVATGENNTDAAAVGDTPAEILEARMIADQREAARQAALLEQRRVRLEAAEARRQERQAQWAAARAENDRIYRERQAEMSRHGANEAEQNRASNNVHSSTNARESLRSSISSLETDITDINAKIAFVESYLQNLPQATPTTSDIINPQQDQAPQGQVSSQGFIVSDVGDAPGETSNFIVEDFNSYLEESLNENQNKKDLAISAARNIISDREDHIKNIVSHHEGIVMQRQNILSNLGIFNSIAVAAGDEERTIEKGVWALGVLSNCKQAETNQIRAYKNKAVAFALGFDAEIMEDLTVGIAYSNVHSKLKVYDRKNYNIVSHAASLYAQNNKGNFILNHNISLSTNLAKTESQFGKGKMKTYSTNIHNDVGYKFKLSEKVAIIPTIGLGYIYFKNNSFVESGKNNYKLLVPSKSSSQLTGEASVKLLTMQKFDNGVSILPEIYGGLRHANSFGKKTIQANISYSNQTIEEPIILSGKKQKTSFVAGAGVQIDYNDINLGINYDCILGKKYINNSGSLRVKVSF